MVGRSWGGFLPDCALIASNGWRLISCGLPVAKTAWHHEEYRGKKGKSGRRGGGNVAPSEFFLLVFALFCFLVVKNRCWQIKRASEPRTGDRKIRRADGRDRRAFPPHTKGDSIWTSRLTPTHPAAVPQSVHGHVRHGWQSGLGVAFSFLGR